MGRFFKCCFACFRLPTSEDARHTSRSTHCAFDNGLVDQVEPISSDGEDESRGHEDIAGVDDEIDVSRSSTSENEESVESTAQPGVDSNHESTVGDEEDATLSSGLVVNAQESLSTAQDDNESIADVDQEAFLSSGLVVEAQDPVSIAPLGVDGNESGIAGVDQDASCSSVSVVETGDSNSTKQLGRC